MNAAVELVGDYWASGGWFALPLAAISFSIWYSFLRSRARLRSALAWEGADLGGADWTRAARRIEDEATRDFVVLAAWTAAAPLVGLAGTVGGMIRTFFSLAQGVGETGIHVAGGISQALITTQAGLAIAIPGLFGLARLERMASQFRVRTAAIQVERRARLYPCPEAAP